jgi:predicted RNase H-like nuclease (RuvC/YqgF family)
MVGKSISKAMLPYLTGIDVKTAFLKLQKITGISTIIEESEGNIKKIEALENALIELEKENKNLKTRIEVLQSKLETHETIITDLNERLTYFEKHGKKKPPFVFR